MLKHSVAVVLLVVGASAASADELKVFSGGAPQQVLRAVIPMFEQASGHKVNITFQVVSQIQRRLAAGEQVDLIVLPEQLIAEVEKSMPLRGEGRGALARVGTGVIVREGAARPDISNEDAVRRSLRAAKAITLSPAENPNGQYLDSLLVRMGLAEELKPRLIRKAAIDGGGELVAKGEADIGLYLASEAQHIPGTTMIGFLPPALQNYVVYGTAIPASNHMPEAALAFIRFLTAPANADRWRQGGLEPTAKP